MTADLSRRYFFAKAPIWLRTLPSFGACALLFVPAAILRLTGVYVRGTGYALFNMIALMGFAFMGLLIMTVIVASKRPTPILTIDSKGLTTPIQQTLPWSTIREVFVSKYYGLVPVLCISTFEDRNLISKAIFPFSIRYLLNQRIVGAPITIPEVRDLPLADVARLIEQYRSDARQPAAP